MAEITKLIIDDILTAELRDKVIANINIDAVAKIMAKDIVKSITDTTKNICKDREWMEDRIYEEVLDNMDLTPVKKFLNDVIKENF